MTITFIPLAQSHFPLLLNWLEIPHVKAWWDKDVHWTPELIQDKYGNYVKGNKSLKLQDQVIDKPVNAFIMAIDDTPMGYIQTYNPHDFPAEPGYDPDLPASCAGLDWYIGEVDFTSKGIGTTALLQFMEEWVFPTHELVIVDPETANTAAIRVYEKAGFKIKKLVKNGAITWMVRTK
jgi:aminoglycoside 6'-N-acetyltransferase